MNFRIVDIFFVEEGNNDIDLESPFGLINFEKRLMIAKVITDLRLYQQKGYALEGNSISCFSY